MLLKFFIDEKSLPMFLTNKKLSPFSFPFFFLKSIANKTDFLKKVFKGPLFLTGLLQECELWPIFRDYGVVVITTAQLHSTKPEPRFCAGSNSARGVLEIRQWFWLEIRINAFRRSAYHKNNSSFIRCNF